MNNELEIIVEVCEAVQKLKDQFDDLCKQFVPGETTARELIDVAIQVGNLFLDDPVNRAIIKRLLDRELEKLVRAVELCKMLPIIDAMTEEFIHCPISK